MGHQIRMFLSNRLASIGRLPLVRSRLALAAGICLTLVPVLFGQVDEYQVKAFFLYNFARYVQWPSQKFNAPADPIVICVLGQNPFGTDLEDAVRGKVVESRAVVVRHISDIYPQCHCHILFVSGPERKRFRSSLGAIKGSGILTVGETEGFANEDGVVNLKLEDGKVRFEINVRAAEEEQLRISSKLLNLARIVKK